MARPWNTARPIATAICVFVLAAIASLAEAQPAAGGASVLGAPTPAFSPAARPAASERSDGLAEALADPRSSTRTAAAPDPGDLAPRPQAASDGEADVAPGPRVELGYSLYGMSDGESRGRVHAGSFGGYFQTGSLRLGVYAEVGKRADRLSVDDLMVRAVALAGYQYRLRNFVPYLAAVGSYGWLIEQGTGAPRTAALPGGGLEVGLDLRLGAVFLGVSAAWMRIRLRGEGQELFLLRIRAGV